MKWLMSLPWFPDKNRELPMGDRLLIALSISLLFHAGLFHFSWPQGASSKQALPNTSLAIRIHPPSLNIDHPARNAETRTSNDAVPNSMPIPPIDSAPKTTSPSPNTGLPLYYPAKELDILAQETSPILLYAIEEMEGITQPILLRVYINEQGNVDLVSVISNPENRELASILALFQHAHFSAAQKKGQAVKSYKLIRIEPERSNNPLGR